MSGFCQFRHPDGAIMKVLITVGAIFGFFGSLSVTNNHRESDLWWAVASALFFAALLPMVARLGVNRRSEKHSRGEQIF